jgi:hypothetical protein
MKVDSINSPGNEDPQLGIGEPLNVLSDRIGIEGMRLSELLVVEKENVKENHRDTIHGLPPGEDDRVVGQHSERKLRIVEPILRRTIHRNNTHP